jgi:hypothetical protein
MRALDIIKDAYQRCNRLSPGEVLSADDSEFGFDRLNLLVDELSGQASFLYREILTTATQTGHITLGVGAWASIAPGEDIVGGACDNLPMDPITIQKYSEQYRPLTTTGRPLVFAPDGMDMVYMWPVPAGQSVTLQTRSTVSQFADLTTDYTAPDGWRNALGASLAVRIAPNILGQIPAGLLRAEKVAMGVVDKPKPAIVDVTSFNRTRSVYPRRFF